MFCVEQFGYLGRAPLAHSGHVTEPTDQSTKRPNILWIFLDQCRADVLGCYGHPFVATPNIDRLARSGVLFETAFCQNPVCVPSRASILSGMYCHHIGVYNNSDKMKPGHSLLLHSFVNAGYRTASVGKVHLGLSPREAGFQEHRAIQHDGTPHMHVPEGYPADWPWKTFTAPGYPQPVIYATDMCSRERTYCAVGVDEAIDIFTTHDSAAAPLLLRLSLDRPHTPVSSPKPYDAMYAECTRLPGFSEAERRKELVSLRQYRHRREWDQFTDDEILKIRHYYYGLVTHLDHELGRLLDAVEGANTLIVLTADHGCMLGEHGLYVKGPHYYAQTARVPLLISMPGRLPSGRRVAGLVELVDLLPTLCELCEVPVPGRAVGHSLVPLILGEGMAREDVFAEQKLKDFHWVAVRTPRYSYTRYLDTGDAMLFDLEEDPDEIDNLAAEGLELDVVRDAERRISARKQAVV